MYKKTQKEHNRHNKIEKEIFKKKNHIYFLLIDKLANPTPNPGVLNFTI